MLRFFLPHLFLFSFNAHAGLNCEALKITDPETSKAERLEIALEDVAELEADKRAIIDGLVLEVLLMKDDVMVPSAIRTTIKKGSDTFFSHGSNLAQIIHKKVEDEGTITHYSLTCFAQ